MLRTNNGSQTKAEVVIEAVDELTRAARRLWEQASDALDRMRSRLNRLEVTEANAHRIWGPATVVFLGVLHIARAIRRKGVLLESVPPTNSLIRTWLAMIISDRDQGDDYASNSSCIYEGRMFPSIAWDLSSRFKEAPHPEVLGVICIALAHVLACSRSDKRGPIPVTQWLVLRDVIGDIPAEVFHDKPHLEHLWKSYFCDDGEGIVWNEVQEALDGLEHMTWHDHPGLRDLAIMERLSAMKAGNGTSELSEPLRRRLTIFKSGGCKFEEVSRYAEACGNSRCARYGIETAEIQGLRELRPVICPCCGCLLVPDLLGETFRRLNDGGAS